MPSNPVEYIKEIMSAPLGELISSIGHGVADAQAALDAGSLAQTLAIYNTENNDELTTLLRDIGYQPTFYVLPETEVEAQISLSFTINNSVQDPINPKTSENTSDSATKLAVPVNATSPAKNLSKIKMYAMPLNAGNTNRFNLSGNSFVKIKFKIVPVPPPSTATEMRVIPKLVNLEFEEAKKLLSQLGLLYKLKTDQLTGKVCNQNILAGTNCKVGDVIEIELEP